MKVTEADEQLLSLLREDARASTAEIARRLGLSRTTVQNRITRLEQEGVIRGYTVRVDDESGSCIFHGSDVLKVQHSLGGAEGIGGKLPLPCLVFG